jgi:NAD+ kinase
MVKKVAILYHPMVEATYAKAMELHDFLVARGISAWLCSAWEKDHARAQLNGTDLILSIGGDGTILRSAHVALHSAIPITGINLGRIGFMTELSADEVTEKLPELLAGKGWIDQRSMIDVELQAVGQTSTQTLQALNDVVVARGAISRMVHVGASLDGQVIGDYRADGVIVSTATGSTGYALAAGGPILYPKSTDCLVVPVAAHLSPAYPLVLPSTAVIQLRIATVHQAVLSVDGHINLPLSDGDTVTIKHSPHTTRFQRIHPETVFYSSLEQKLKGNR